MMNKRFNTHNRPPSVVVAAAPPAPVPTNNHNNMTSSTSDEVNEMVAFTNSVLVTEDMRRSVVAETDLVSEAISNLAKANKNEEATESRLLQELRSAHKELLKQERDTRDKRESATVQLDYRQQLSDTLKTRLIDPLAVSLPAHTLQRLFPEDENMSQFSNNDSFSDSSSPATATSSSSNPKFLAQAKQKVLYLGNDLQEASTLLDQRKASITRKQQDTLSIQKQMEEQRLDASLQSLRRDVSAKRHDLQDVDHRLRTVQESIQTRRDRGGTAAQQVSELTTELSTLKDSNASNEADVNKQAQEKQQAFDAMKASSTVQQQLEDIANKRAKLKATMDSIQEERQARESKRTEITRLETEKTEKVAAKEAILAKIVTAKKEREESANRLQAARAAEEQIGELKGANDALENIQSTKDKFELEGLGKEKENSTRITTSMTENAAKTFEELSSKRNENASILQSLQEEHSRHQQDLEDKELKLINFKNCGETSLETSRKALEDHVKRKEQCRRDNEAQSERRASLIAEHIEAAEKNLPLVEEELAAREDFYTYAKSYVVESNKLRDKLAAKGIGL